jgi:cyclopropane-fatty-acyl-phospholipid synthase
MTIRRIVIPSLPTRATPARTSRARPRTAATRRLARPLLRQPSMRGDVHTGLPFPLRAGQRARPRPRHQPGRLRARFERALRAADVVLDGPADWDPQVHDPRTFGRILRHGSLGAGESYVEGWWDCERLDELVHRVLRHDVLPDAFGDHGDLLRHAAGWLVNLQTRARATKVARAHYDLGDDLFRTMLDAREIYSCGYWRDAATLDQAQEAKLDLVCRKLALEPGMRVLDVGCGWGGAARWAAERWGVSVTGVTISEDQVRVGRERCRGLPVEIQLRDYRDVEGRYDRVFSLGMFEHVGAKNHRAFMRVIHDHLEPEGLFLLHTIGNLRSGHTSDAWIARYIFPNSLIPSAAQITAAAEGLFVLEDWHSFGADYDTTLLHWYRNFERGWPGLAARYGERFRRMWRYYLLSCAGSFRARRNQLWQIVLSPRGVRGVYPSVR